MDDHIKQKLDPALAAYLEEAHAETTLRAIVVLGPKIIQEPSLLNPSQFPSRQEYRSAAIAQQQLRMERALADAVNNLCRLGLTVQGGNIARTVILSGTVRQFREALRLAEVLKAELDTEIPISC